MNQNIERRWQHTSTSQWMNVMYQFGWQTERLMELERSGRITRQLELSFQILLEWGISGREKELPGYLNFYKLIFEIRYLLVWGLYSVVYRIYSWLCGSQIIPGDAQEDQRGCLGSGSITCKASNLSAVLSFQLHEFHFLPCSRDHSYSAGTGQTLNSFLMGALSSWSAVSLSAQCLGNSS